jgi:uncharacterized membrane protein YraQ (UPF0718 family)
MEGKAFMNIGLYFAVLLLLIVSYVKDTKKTISALKKALKSFDNILPDLLMVILIVGILMAVMNPETITKVIGSDSGWIGVVLASIVGSITLIPGFIAFPTAAILLDGGAGYMQIGAFISTLMMVGVVTLPVEIKYFGRKLALYRNIFAFMFSFLVAYVIGVFV